MTELEKTESEPLLSESQISTLTILTSIGLIAALIGAKNLVFPFLVVMTLIKTTSFWYYEKKLDLFWMACYSILMLTYSNFV